MSDFHQINLLLIKISTNNDQIPHDLTKEDKELLHELIQNHCLILQKNVRWNATCNNQLLKKEDSIELCLPDYNLLKKLYKRPSC